MVALALHKFAFPKRGIRYATCMTDDKRVSMILLISCPDRCGIVAAVTRFLADHRANIINLDEHVDLDAGVFFMRVEWDVAGCSLQETMFAEEFAPVANDFDMQWELHRSDRVQRMGILVSKLPHCLFDLLFRVQTHEWNVEVPVIISNHPDLESVAQQFGIPFHCLPLTPDNKAEQEAAILELLSRHRVDFVVLARYMQILSPEFVRQYPMRIINIHHSFLPAFPGAKPYHSAHARGVKVIGATSHYVTAELDEGPIIEQDIVRVSHKDSIADFIRKGRDLEKIVLARAVRCHILHKILVYNKKTVIFD